MNNNVYPADVSTQSLGKLKVNLTSSVNSRPIEDATVTISLTSNPSVILETLKTNSAGQTEEIELAAPKIEYSLEPSVEQPYSEYTINMTAPGFEGLLVNGAQILPDVTAVQNSTLLPKAEEGAGEEYFVIAAHTLYGEYPPKIAEPEIKDLEEKGIIVLEDPVIPEFVVVHDGPPKDTGAQNHYIKYKDYIKNVASSEIYATWTEATIQANVLAIQSFTLNRVYTEWYKNKGYNFTITSSTAYDHKFMPERNIFEPISKVVDTIFSNYLSFPNVKQPILTQYCDGKRVSCPGWMTQWGSQDLGEKGYTAIEILRNFYGDSMYINSTNEVAGVPYSWPGAPLQIGSSGNSVRQIQEQLNGVSKGYPMIPKLAVDGKYGEGTSIAVELFQKIFGLPETGVVDYPTWYKLSDIYVGVSRIAELR